MRNPDRRRARTLRAASADRARPEYAMRAVSSIALSLVLSGTLVPTTAFTQAEPAQVVAAGGVRWGTFDTSGPPYFAAPYRHMMSMPRAAKVFKQSGFPASIAQLVELPDPQGQIGGFQPAGATATSTNAFFQSLGTNGRSCFTCHQPLSGMSISLDDIDQRFRRFGLRDPLFAPVDGATCPKNVPQSETQGGPVGNRRGAGKRSLADAYATLLKQGLIRVVIPLNAPPRGPTSAPATEFTIEVVSDPYGCNTDPQFNQDTADDQTVIDPDTGKPVQLISVYRRPRIAANLTFATTAFKFPAPATQPVPAAESGNIMWDGREPSLASQARDATLIHAQANVAPTTAQIQQIIDFETGFFSAQVTGPHNLDLTQLSLAGPIVLSSQAPGQLTQATGGAPTTFALFSTWPDSLSDKAARESIAGGEVVFNTKRFLITNDAGANPLPTPSKPSTPISATCSSCHSQKFSGNGIFAGAQQDLGIGGTSASFGGPAPSSFLPIFKITCKAGVTQGFHGSTITTNDPGLALITGKCADVGKFTVPQLRGLAAHPPYFSDGSAATLMDVVNFYDKRFQINFTAQEKEDLVHFLNSL